LHKLFTEIAANLKAKDGEYHHKLWWKTMCKDEWLGYDDFRKPNGEVINVLRSTSDCSVEELTEFMMKVEEYANNRGVYLDE
jgi:hypothetical protein